MNEVRIENKYIIFRIVIMRIYFDNKLNFNT